MFEATSNEYAMAVITPNHSSVFLRITLFIFSPTSFLLNKNIFLVTEIVEFHFSSELTWCGSNKYPTED